ncbi:MAG TPA: histidine kinase [Solirubrobacteraceae bacterium]|jgi:two-component system sensor histidine kinase DesK
MPVNSACEVSRDDQRAVTPVVLRFGPVASWLWIGLLGFPLAELIKAHVTGLHLALVLVGLAVFVATFVLLLVGHDKGLSARSMALLVGLLFAISVAMTAGDRAGWATMFVYTAAVASMWMFFSARVAALAVLACVVSATAIVAARGAGTGTIVSVAASCAGVGFLMLCFGQLRIRNLELLSARDEIARLAVADERVRFARDLHDLLGHSLSVIALKAELASRLLERDTEAAAVHVGDLEQVARKALAEVREAVSGYRRPALASELDGARIALDAAGIEAHFDRCETTLDPQVEALLAWTVREGTTNVIRHSGARSCTVALEPGLATATVEVLDDGVGGDQGDGVGLLDNHGQRGHGLVGLRERAERLGGQLQAGPGPDGGFQLRVTVPTGIAA